MSLKLKIITCNGTLLITCNLIFYLFKEHRELSKLYKWFAESKLT